MRKLTKKIIDNDSFFTIQDIGTGRTTTYDKQYLVQCSITRNTNAEGIVRIVDENDPSIVILNNHYEEISINGKKSISPLNCREVLKSIVQKQGALLHKHLISSNSREGVVSVEKLKLNAIKNQVVGDRSYTYEIVCKPNGLFGIRERRPDIVFNFTESFSSSIQVNHIYPSNIPERPRFADDLQQILENYKNLDFTILQENDWVVETLNNLDNSANQRFFENGRFSVNTNSTVFVGLDNSQEFVKIKADRRFLLPNDRNWIMKIEIDSYNDNYNGGGMFAGVSQKGNSNIVAGVRGFDYSSTGTIGANKGLGNSSRDRVLVLIIKIGSILTTIAYRDNQATYHSQTIYEELGECCPQISLKGRSISFNGRVSIKKF